VAVEETLADCGLVNAVGKHKNRADDNCEKLEN